MLTTEILGSRTELGKGLVSRNVECVALVAKATLALSRQQEGFTPKVTFSFLYLFGLVFAQYLGVFFFLLSVPR